MSIKAGGDGTVPEGTEGVGRGEGRADAGEGGGAMRLQVREGILPLFSALLTSPCTAGARFGSSTPERRGRV